MFDKLKELVDTVPILEKGSWKNITEFPLQGMTKKAARIGWNWIPLTQLRVDPDSQEIFCSSWWYKNNLRNKLRA